ncbi:MAG: hypothetical protein EXX96DRAFT_607098 [Benjaminiella poitrasii]|nr:MAG: hypothetical protein EXX96DRAFT_607098 [Benjaminiella poitrasii]
MNHYQTSIMNNYNVRDWLMIVPNCRESYDNDTYQTHSFTDTNESSSIQKERPLSLQSISSEASVNLEDFINANFTTNMDDETDLPSLSLLGLDDSDEEFWKVDNYEQKFSHSMLTQLMGEKNQNDYRTTCSISSFGKGQQVTLSKGLDDLHVFELNTCSSFVILQSTEKYYLNKISILSSNRSICEQDHKPSKSDITSNDSSLVSPQSPIDGCKQNVECISEESDLNSKYRFLKCEQIRQGDTNNHSAAKSNKPSLLPRLHKSNLNRSTSTSTNSTDSTKKVVHPKRSLTLSILGKKNKKTKQLLHS